MTKTIRLNGVVASAPAELADKLVLQGWEYINPEAETPAEAPKRRGRPKKTEV